MKNAKVILIFLSLLFIQTTAVAKPKLHYFYEADYQNYWCSANNGITEYILPDKARIDCLTEDYAIEFDFANKWAESIGQSVYYAHATNKIPGIVLIMEQPKKDQKYLKRILEIAPKHNITVWVITPDDMKNANIATKY